MEKKFLRKQGLRLRDAMLPADRDQKSTIICDKLISLDIYQQAKHIMMFAAFGSEIDLTQLREHAWAHQKIIYLPVVDQNSGYILPIETNSLKELKRSAYGILEPSLSKYQEDTLRNIDLVLVPAIFFDLQGYRLGYGAAYYDYLLPRLSSHCYKLGVGFDAQIISFLPREPHDVPLDALLSNRQWIEVNQYAK